MVEDLKSSEFQFYKDDFNAAVKIGRALGMSTIDIKNILLYAIAMKISAGYAMRQVKQILESKTTRGK